MVLTFPKFKTLEKLSATDLKVPNFGKVRSRLGINVNFRAKNPTPFVYPKGDSTSVHLRYVCSTFFKISANRKYSLQEIRQGATKVHSGFPEIRQGSTKVRNGLPEIRQGTANVCSGFPEIRQGTAKVRSGLQEIR